MERTHTPRTIWSPKWTIPTLSHLLLLTWSPLSLSLAQVAMIKKNHSLPPLPFHTLENKKESFVVLFFSVDNFLFFFPQQIFYSVGNTFCGLWCGGSFNSSLSLSLSSPSLYFFFCWFLFHGLTPPLPSSTTSPRSQCAASRSTSSIEFLKKIFELSRVNSACCQIMYLILNFLKTNKPKKKKKKKKTLRFEFSSVGFCYIKILWNKINEVPIMSCLVFMWRL